MGDADIAYFANSNIGYFIFSHNGTDLLSNFLSPSQKERLEENPDLLRTYVRNFSHSFFGAGSVSPDSVTISKSAAHVRTGWFITTRQTNAGPMSYMAK